MLMLPCLQMKDFRLPSAKHDLLAVPVLFSGFAESSIIKNDLLKTTVLFDEYS